MGLDLGPFRLASLTGPYHASVSARFARGTHATQPPPSSSPHQSPTPVRVPVPQLRRRRSGRSRSGAEPPMAEGERELHVRALDGRSTVVALAAAASVRNLKAALRSSFPPAQVSPSFHLFLKVRPLASPLRASLIVLVDGCGLRDAVCFVSLHARGIEGFR